MRAARTAVLGLAIACSSGGESWKGVESRSPLPADRREYVAFRAAHPELELARREPNYFPFLLHRLRVPGSADDLLVACRWPDEAFPLRVAIEAPSIDTMLDETLDDSPRPTPAAEYVEAVRRALAQWERELGPPIAFRSVEANEGADVRIRLVGEKAPTPEDGKLVLGMTPLGDACVVSGGDPESGRIDARMVGAEVRIFVADDFGLLTPEQVETVAAHEIGHALGARSHSPLPADLMHEIARDRLGARRLSASDLHSFAALYALANGSVFATRVGGEPAPPTLAKPPEGPPELAERASERDFEIALPAGWTVIPVERGLAAVDGLAWDYDASLQVLSIPVGSIREYLDRYGAAHLEKGPLLGQRAIEIGGRRALRLAVVSQESETVEEVTLVEGEGQRLLLAIAEAPVESFDAYAPWIHASLDTLRIREADVEPPAATPSP